MEKVKQFRSVQKDRGSLFVTFKRQFVDETQKVAQLGFLLVKAGMVFCPVILETANAWVQAEDRAASVSFKRRESLSHGVEGSLSGAELQVEQL
jgi:hypothetical protein